jgi:prevent-host-death family protein
MSTQTLPVTEVRAKLPQLVKAADERFERTVITSNGNRAVIMAYDETRRGRNEEVCDLEAMRAIRDADEESAGSCHGGSLWS